MTAMEIAITATAFSVFGFIAAKYYYRRKIQKESDLYLAKVIEFNIKAWETVERTMLFKIKEERDQRELLQAIAPILNEMKEVNGM